MSRPSIPPVGRPNTAEELTASSTSTGLRLVRWYPADKPACFTPVEERLRSFRRPTGMLSVGDLPAIDSPSRVSCSLGVGLARRCCFTPRISRLMFPMASANARRLALLHVFNPCLAARLPSVALLHINHIVTRLEDFRSRPPRGETAHAPTLHERITVTQSPPPGNRAPHPRCLILEGVCCWRNPPRSRESGWGLPHRSPRSYLEKQMAKRR